MWLNERNAVALDESWREPTNLQAKVLKHQSFESEILANRYRVDAATKVESVCVFVCVCYYLLSPVLCVWLEARPVIDLFSVHAEGKPAVIYKEQSVVCKVTLADLNTLLTGSRAEEQT